MTQINPYLIENKKTIEEVSYLEEIKLPTIEQIRERKRTGQPGLNEEEKQLIRKKNWSQQEIKVYCSYNDCPYSSPFEIKISIEGISRKWARNHGTGSFLAGTWD